MPYDQLGKVLILAGALILALGLVIWLLGRLPFAGRLPGEIVITRGNVTCLAPIVTMILVSIILTIILNIALRLLNR